MNQLVNIVEPNNNLGDRGDQQGQRTLMRAVRCSIKFLSGRESEVARQKLAMATVSVTMRGPIAGLTARCELHEYPIIAGVPKAKWHVGYVEDASRTGHELVCLCEGEV